MKGLWRRLGSVPHLFGKCMVIWCVAWGSICSLYALRILARTGNDATGMLGVILAFFGGELALMFGKNALEKKHGKDDKNDGSDSHD